ncbi:amino acid permease [Aminirod propionatiphilus]|uniref:Amino acid permease n=1 Tax=Aminirod propionatiphilus TaxID=3415223 RepID=A0ACD1DU64_9BACT|nr:amino acid permease [Synergistota bacterium]
MTENRRNGTSSGGHSFGTFGGVFTPTTLTILGVIMFLRFGQVVGQAGTLNALLIVLGAKSITLLTSFSVAAIATNTQVKGGGAYFLISRTLGVEYGGVIAIFLYIAQATSVALYVIGFTEAFVGTFPVTLSFRLIATVVNVAVFLCVYIGAGWTIKVQYGILAVLVLSVLSFLAGALPQSSIETFRANLHSAYLPGQSFFTMFALFFPAVTGIMAGVNMSGDLRDPGKSIPDGTFAAVLFTGAIYLSMALFLGASRPQEALIHQGLIVREIAWSPLLITAGVFAATLSSALGSMMGAPRVLQAFAADDVFSRLRPFAKGSGPAREPRRATIVTFLIAQTAIVLGDLDAVAPIITMFFMVTYGTLNLACFLEGITRNPSFRPRFRWHHWALSLLGALLCLAVMFLINVLWAAVAILIMVAVYGLIGRAEVLAAWGDLSSGLAFQRARWALLRLEKERYHPKNWRPSILALSGGAWSRNHLAEYACWLSAGRGVVSLAQILFGDVEELVVRRNEAERLLRRHIQEEGRAAFPAVVVEEDLGKGIKTLLQCHGIGGVRPNTILMGWSEDPRRVGLFGRTLRLCRAMGRSVVVVRYDRRVERNDEEAPKGSLNIWWREPHNGALMLLLAHLMKQNRIWRNHPLRILCPVPPRADRENLTAEMTDRLALARIDAEIVVLPTDDPLSALRAEVVREPFAALFVGFEPPEEGHEEAFIDRYRPVTELPGDVILVSSSGDVALEA